MYPIRGKCRTALAVTAVLLAGLPPAAAVPASKAAYASVGISQHRGWDACGIGTTGNAQAFWSNTPYWNMGLYLGGAGYGAGCTRWTAANVAGLRAQGWKFLPLWVGPQAPCTGFAARFSADPATAYAQGRTEARSAYDKLKAFGLDTVNTPVTYDLEAFDTTNAGCLNAARQFVSGWVFQMHVPTAQLAGVYGSSCASGLSAFAGIADVPDFIDGANWSGDPNTRTLACVPAGAWTAHQRHKQYRGDHLETWNGVTLNVDNDCSDGPVYPAPDQLGTAQGCLGGSTATASAPLDAARVTDATGWVLTADRLLLTRDGGATLTPVDVPVPPDPVRAASFVDAETGAVAAGSGATLTVATTRDGGRTWRARTVTDPAAGLTGHASLSLAFADADHGALLARTATSQAFSVGTLFTTTDGGTTWSAQPAPEAGRVAIEPGGRIWLAGTGLHSTVDAGRTWTRAELALAGPVGAVTIAPPVRGTLPVTVVVDGHTEVQLLTSDDGGRTWIRRVRVPVRAGTGAGVPVPVASTATGPLVLDPVPGHAYGAGSSDRRPTGLPAGVWSTSFTAAGRTGWALTANGTCAKDKQDCRVEHTLVGTADSGTTWAPVARWAVPVS